MTPIATTTPAPAPSGLPDDVAFVVRGVLVSPDGATEVGFSMTVGLPTKETAAADAAAFADSEHCPPEQFADGASSIADPSCVHVEIETDLVAGALGDDYALPTGVGTFQTWSGDYAGFQAACSTPVLTPVPSAASGILEASSIATTSRPSAGSPSEAATGSRSSGRTLPTTP